MISWFSNWLGTTSALRRRTPTRDSPIFLKDFVDFDLDVVGLYAQGHYSPRDFLAAVKCREPHTKISVNQVRWTWAKFEGKELIEFKDPIPGTEPITLIDRFL